MFDRIREKLDERVSANRLRRVQSPISGIDFCSNDYLGFGSELITLPPLVSGAGASRLISGYTDDLARLEFDLAATYKGETATFFSSGYEANMGVVRMLHEMGINMLYDEHIHSSMRSALVGGSGAAWKYKHLDMNDLESKLRRCNTPVVVLTEGLFSMDGDQGDLEAFSALKEKYGFSLIVDEAHSTGTSAHGLLGWSGAFADLADVRIHTFGKALGVQGAVVVASRLFQQALHNFCRVLIYSTASSPVLTAAVRIAHDRYAAVGEQRREQLQTNIASYLSCVSDKSRFSAQSGPIQWFATTAGSHQLHEVVGTARSAGFAVYGIQPPTVPDGHERIRICIHSFNRSIDIEQLCTILQGNTYI